MGLVEGRDWKESKAESKLIFSNGSEVLFRHLEEPDKIKSLNLGFVEIEEMSDIPQATFDMLLGRLRQAPQEEWGSKFKYRLFGHTNPESRKGWIYRYFVEDKKPNYRRIIAPTTENSKNLPKGFIESMKDRYDEEYFNRNVLGQDGDYASGLVCKGFNRQDNIDSTISIDKTKPLYICCDFNIDPMCWYIAQHYNGNIYYLYELVENYTDTLTCAKLLAELLKGEGYINHKIIITGDASGNNTTANGKSNFKILNTVLLQEGFSNIDFEVASKNPSINYRYNCWNNKLRDKDGQPHIFIHPQCKYLVYDIENLEIEVGSNKPKKPSTGRLKTDNYAKYLTHPTDSASYLVYMNYPIQEVTSYEDYKGTYKDVFGRDKYEYNIGI